MNRIDLPADLEIALSQNEQAIKNFGKMSDDEESAFIIRTHSVRSMNEMQLLINELSGKNFRVFKLIF